MADMPQSSYCEDSFNRITEQLLDYNKSSAWGYTALKYCAENTGNESDANAYRDALFSIAATLFAEHNGATVETAVPVRELSEVSMLLTNAGIEVIDGEAIHVGRKLYFKLHCYDVETNSFSFRYFSNYDFFKSYLVELIGEPIHSDIEASRYLSLLYSSVSLDEVVVELAWANLLTQDYDAITSAFAQQAERSELANVLLAQSYLNQHNDKALDSLLDRIFTYSESGSVVAKAFIAQFLFVKDTSNQSNEDIAELLNEMANMSKGRHHGMEYFIQLLSSREDFAFQLNRLLAEFPDLNIEDDIYQVALSYQAQSTGRRYFDTSLNSMLNELEKKGYDIAQLSQFQR